MGKRWMAILILGIMLIGLQLPCGAAGSSNAGTQPVKEIQGLMDKYEKNFVKAVNEGDFKLIAPYMISVSPFYGQQYQLVGDLHKKKVKEKLVEYKLQFIDYSDPNVCLVYTSETIAVTSKGKTTNHRYAWIYTVGKDNGIFKIDSLEKWTDYDYYFPKEPGLFFHYNCFEKYGYWLERAIRSNSTAWLKAISASDEAFSKQQALITELKKIGNDFRCRFVRYDFYDDESEYNTKYFFSCTAKDGKPINTVLKIKLSLNNPAPGKTDVLKIGDVSVQGIERIQIPLTGKSPRDFVPDRWKVLEQAEGDLNGDKAEDLAVILQEDAPWETPADWEAPERLLVILLKQADGTYLCAVRSFSAIMRGDEGGVFGDPFEGISIKNNVLTVSFYGGSRDRWGYTYKFRYQDRGYYLIGVTEYEGDTLTLAFTTRDYNLLTGNETMTTGTEGGKKTQKTIDRGQKPLVRLEDFNVDTINDTVF